MTSISNKALACIGIRLGGVSIRPRDTSDHDIERVLLRGAAEMRRDGRLASLLFSWIHVHADHVIVEKLRKLVRSAEDEDQALGVSALAAYAASQGRHKWKKLIRRQSPKACLFTGRSASSAIRLKGAEPWAEEQGILIARGSLRIRPADILAPNELARLSLQYRNRLLFGASWRADIITAIQQGAATATEVMKRVGCSYEPAHRVRREYLIASES